MGPVNRPPVTGALCLLRRPFSDLGDRTGRGSLGSTALGCPADLGALVRGPRGPHGGRHHCVPSAPCPRPCGWNPRPPCRQAPAPTLRRLDGGQPCRPGSPRPGLANVRGLGPAATALVTRSVQHPQRPRCPLCPAHLLPRPEATVLLAGASPPHTPSGLRIPRLKAQAGPTFQGNALSPPNPSPAPTPTDGRGCIALQLGSQHPDPSRRSGTRWAAQGPSLRPQLRSGLGDTGRGAAWAQE